MKIKLKATVFLIAVLGALLSIAGSAQQADDPGVLLRAAIGKEEVDGDLQGAIDLYKEIIAKYGGNRAIAAKAQLHIGFCYEKLGKAEAIKAYELVLKNFADQLDLVATARARIAQLKMKKPLGLSVEKLPRVMEVPAFSRDGTLCAGIDWSVPGQNISIYDYTTNKLTPITHFDWTSEGHGWTYFPVFSPDAKEVAYVFSPHKENNVIELRASTLDGKSRTLYRLEKGMIRPCDWISDGSAIVVLLRNESKSWTLGLIPAVGEEFKALYALEGKSERPPTRPQASPNGRFIAFREGPWGKSDIKVITIDGEPVGNLTDHPANDTDICWSPDGKHVMFKSNRHGSWALWGMEVKDGKPASKPFMIRPGMENTGLIKWTSKGLACETFVMTRDIFVMSVDPKTGEPLDKARMIDYIPTGGNGCPVWSPDGKYLAFYSNKKKKGPYIVMMPASGGKAREYLIETDVYRGFISDLRWLPNSSGLGFTTNVAQVLSGEVKRTLFRLDLATGEWKTWPVPGTMGGTLGRAGKTYIYAKQGKDHIHQGIVERDLSTGKERYIYRDPDEKMKVVRGLKFSRDFRYLTYSLRRYPAWNYEIVVLDTETGEDRVVGSDFRSPAWSADRKHLLALANPREGGRPKTMSVLPTEGGPQRELKLGDNLPKDCHLLLPDWSPDGKKIAFGTRYSIHEAFLLKNILPKK